VQDRLIDSKAREHLNKYLVQCAIASAAVVAMLLLLDVLRQAAIVSSLGATAFITFTQPHSHASRPRSLLGGYAAGTVIGLTFTALRKLLLVLSAGNQELLIAGLAGALAVGLSMLVMVFTNTEHPPAAGLALGIVVNEWTPTTLAVVLLGVIILYGAKTALKSYLIDLR
jgi:CBS-domain-containing membrane protein